MNRSIIFALLALLLLIQPAAAATVYLRDGGTIDCLLARQEGKLVYILLNRYDEVYLDRSEVKIKKTFKKRRTVGSYHRPKDPPPPQDEAAQP